MMDKHQSNEHEKGSSDIIHVKIIAMDNNSNGDDDYERSDINRTMMLSRMLQLNIIVIVVNGWI